MILPDRALGELERVAVAAARRAGRWIASTRPTSIAAKPGMSSPAAAVVTDVDRRAEALIVEDLRASCQRFELGLLSEERPDDQTRLSRDHFWCIDPLDGTLPYAHDRFGYAVSIALVRRDGVALVGAVHEPRSDTTLHAVRGRGFQPRALTNQHGALGRDDHGDGRAQLAAYCDRSLLDDSRFRLVREALDAVADARCLAGVVIETGAGAVVNACQVLSGRPACYLKLPTERPGGGSLWDFAATSCLALEAGGVASDIHGRPLDLNRRDSTFMNHRGVLFASDLPLADELRTRLRERDVLEPRPR